MQTRTHLRWDDLRVFLALSRRGSLKQAAAELGINISTASRRLDALEDAIGMHLFDRTPDGVRPTAAAEQLLGHAEQMEQAALGIVRGVEQLEAAVEGEVVVTAPPGIVDHFLAPALVELADAFPSLRVTIVSSIGYADLTRREADIALRIRRPTSGDLVSVRVATAGWTIVAAPRHAATLGPLREPDATRWVTWGDELAHLPDRVWIEANVAPSRIVLRSNSMTAQIEAVRGGLGAMLAPPAYATLRGLAAVAAVPTIRRSLAQLPEGELWLVGHRALHQVPRVVVVWDWLKARFRAF
jgi:DNA-binding transcriptional LysR family regulator